MRISDWSSDVCSSDLPGAIATDRGRDVPPEQMAALFKQITAAATASGEAPFEQKSIAQGAATSVWAAAVAEADAIGGRYCEDCQVGEIDDRDGIRPGVRPYALDPRSEEHTSELQSPMRRPNAVF